MLRDFEIRDALIRWIDKQNYECSYRVMREFLLCEGSTRADVAVANGKLIGYEIKSDADNLSRLHSQIPSYDRTFDYVSIVVGNRYSKIINDWLPNHWGIIVAEVIDGNIEIVIKKKPRKNSNIDKRSLLDLLWREELTNFLTVNNHIFSSKMNKRRLREIIESKYGLEVIRDYTREAIKHRIKAE